MTKTERQLHAEGYTFTGIYSSRSRDKEEIKARAADLRKQGIPAKVVAKRYENRGGSGIGWSVYIKKTTTPPAKARPETIDFYWPEIKQARLKAEARARIEEAAMALASEIWDDNNHEGDLYTIQARLLDMHDRGLIEIKPEEQK